MHNRKFVVTSIALLIVTITLGLFQNCSKFSSSVISVGSVAGSSYCGSHSANAACITTSAGVCTFNGQTIANGQTVTGYLTSNGTCTSENRKCQTGVLSGSYAFASCSPTGASACLFNGVTVASGASTTAYLTSTATNCSAATQMQTRTCTNGTLSGTFSYGSCTTDSGAASCLFNGQTVAHGSSVVAFPTSTVAYGSQCQSTLRTCYNGALSGTGDYASCAVSAAASCLFNGQTIASGAAVTAYASSSDLSCAPIQRTCTNGALSGAGDFASCAIQAPQSCAINGQTVASGSTITLYAATTAPPGGSCAAEVRSCTNGSLSGSATTSSCTVSTSASWPSFSIVGGQTQVSGDLTLAMQTDGNLVVYRSGVAVWNSRTAGQCTGTCTMQFQTGGNIVLFQNGQPYWQNYVSGLTNPTLVMSELPPYISVKSNDGRTIWGGGTDLHWMTALNVARGFQGATDFDSLFAHPELWPSALAQINIFKFYSWQIMAFDDTQLATVISFLNVHHISIGIEFGGVSSPDTCGHYEGYLNAAPDLTVAAVSSRIQSLGGTLAYVVMDEPYYFGHLKPDGYVSCGYSEAVLGQNLAATMAGFRAYFPAVNAGDVEPWFFFTGDPTWHASYATFLDAFAAANGAPFALYQDDDIYSDARWPANIVEFRSILAERRIPYGPIFNGTGSGSDTDNHWTTAARAHIQTYHALGLPDPDQVVFQSWDQHPKQLLPETLQTTIPSVINFYFSDPMSRRNGPIPLYRLEVPGGGYIYSTSGTEVATLRAANYVYDGPAGYVYPTGDAAVGLTPIYRLHHPGNNDYLLSISGDEIAAAVALGYLNDGVLGWGFGPADPNGVPLQVATKNGIHLFSTSLAEVQGFGTVELVRFGLVPF